MPLTEVTERRYGRTGDAPASQDAARRPGAPEMKPIGRQGGHAVAPAGAGSSPRPKKIKRDDIIFLANQLAVMVDTGVPLTEALDSINEQTEHTGLKAVISDVSVQVRAGVEFSAALARHPRVFSKLFVSLMRASEVSGTMGKMLRRVTQYLKAERDIRKQIKGAIIYPACMLCFCTLVVAMILIFVMPRFEKVYAGKAAVLPAPTRVLLAMSHGLVHYWYAVLGVILAVGAAIYWYFRTESGKTLLDKVRISLPIIGPMYRKSYLARSMRTMATMVGSGVGMLDGLAITAEVAGNRFYSQIWTNLADRVSEGSGLAEHLRASRIIPNTVAQMVSTGERTGKLELVMDRVAEFCEDDLKTSIKSATSLIEPAMIIVMGVVIGGIAMALLLPVFNVSKIMVR